MIAADFKIGEKVTLGVFPTDAKLIAVVDGFYKEFVVVRFVTDGMWLSVRRPSHEVRTDDANWYHSMMIVHPGNLVKWVSDANSQ